MGEISLKAQSLSVFHLLKENNNSTHFIELWALNEIMDIKYIAQCLTYNKYLLQKSYVLCLYFVVSFFLQWTCTF